MNNIFLYSSRLVFIERKKQLVKKYEGVKVSRGSGKTFMFRSLVLNYIRDLQRMLDIPYDERTC